MSFMTIYAHELKKGYQVLDCSQGQGEVLAIQPVEAGDEEPQYHVVTLLAGKGSHRQRRHTGLLTTSELIKIEPIDDGLDAPIDLGNL